MSTILVVDDEPALRDMLRLYLEQEGFHALKPATDDAHYTSRASKNPIWLSST